MRHCRVLIARLPDSLFHSFRNPEGMTLQEAQLEYEALKRMCDDVCLKKVMPQSHILASLSPCGTCSTLHQRLLLTA